MKTRLIPVTLFLATLTNPHSFFDKHEKLSAETENFFNELKETVQTEMMLATHWTESKGVKKDDIKPESNG